MKKLIIAAALLLSPIAYAESTCEVQGTVVGGAAGAGVGAAAGAKAGAGVGIAMGPAGAVAGSAVGAGVGAVIGALGGSFAGNETGERMDCTEQNKSISEKLAKFDDNRREAWEDTKEWFRSW